MLEIRRAVDFYATYYDKDVSFMNEEGCKIPQQTCILPLKNEICRKCHKKIVKKKHDENIKEKILMEKNTTLLSGRLHFSTAYKEMMLIFFILDVTSTVSSFANNTMRFFVL
jgi:hypothetical protein